VAGQLGVGTGVEGADLAAAVFSDLSEPVAAASTRSHSARGSRPAAATISLAWGADRLPARQASDAAGRALRPAPVFKVAMASPRAVPHVSASHEAGEWWPASTQCVASEARGA
jgi:hypothetical protein